MKNTTRKNQNLKENLIENLKVNSKKNLITKKVALKDSQVNQKELLNQVENTTKRAMMTFLKMNSQMKNLKVNSMIFKRGEALIK